MSSSTPDPRYDVRRTRRRPTAVTVLGILHLVFGGLSLLGGLCTGVTLAVGPANFMPTPPPPPAGAPALPVPPDLTLRLQRFLDAEVPFYSATVLTQVALGLVLSVLMVVAGIGLLSMRPWARTLSLVYAVASVLFQIAGMTYTAAVVIPATNAFYTQMEQDFPNGAPFFALGKSSMWMGLVFTPVWLVYPIVVFVLLTRRGVVEAFKDQPEPPEVPLADPFEPFYPPSTGITDRRGGDELL